jgi:hypothetical protein
LADVRFWAFSPFAVVQRYFRSRRLSRHWADILDLALLTDSVEEVGQQIEVE